MRRWGWLCCLLAAACSGQVDVPNANETSNCPAPEPVAGASCSDPCPDTLPSSGSSCELGEGDNCSYPIESECGPMDYYASCEQGSWHIIEPSGCEL